MNVPKLELGQREPIYRLVKEEMSEEDNLKLTTWKPTLKGSAWTSVLKIRSDNEPKMFMVHGLIGLTVQPVVEPNNVINKKIKYII